MWLVAASRVPNEDDILEAFVRHHAALVGHHIFLDNGGSDRSHAILRALQAEGLPLAAPFRVVASGTPRTACGRC